MMSTLKVRCRFLAVLLFCAGTILMVRPAAGQHGARPPQPGSNLPPESRTVVDRLMSLTALPTGAWKMHSGDLTHGEDASLDDSAWPAVAMGAQTGLGAEWFRQTIAIPDTLHGYDLTGVRVWFWLYAM